MRIKSDDTKRLTYEGEFSVMEKYRKLGQDEGFVFHHNVGLDSLKVSST
jgi:hypothetical protein